MSVDFVLSGRVFAAVLFDLDGTLIDSTEMVDLSWNLLDGPPNTG